jgi:hypothetical protein
MILGLCSVAINELSFHAILSHFSLDFSVSLHFIIEVESVEIRENAN